MLVTEHFSEHLSKMGRSRHVECQAPLVGWCVNYFKANSRMLCLIVYLLTQDVIEHFILGLDGQGDILPTDRKCELSSTCTKKNQLSEFCFCLCISSGEMLRWWWGIMLLISKNTKYSKTHAGH